MRSSVISPTMSENTQSGKKRQYRHILNAQDRPILNAQDQPIPETGCDVEYRGADKLKGKKALITARDHRFATAILYAREGADVTIVFLPDDTDDARETRNAVEKEGCSCLLVPGNMTSSAACEAAVRQHVSKFGHVDILVNNSSKHTQCDDPLNIDLNMLCSVFHREVLAVHEVLAMLGMTKCALPHMKEGSSIIITTSDYFSSKSTILHFTRLFADSLREKGIRVDAVYSCSVRTVLQPAPRPTEYMEDIGSLSRLGRVHHPCKIAPTFVFLASKDAELYSDQVMYPAGDCCEYRQR